LGRLFGSQAEFFLKPRDMTEIPEQWIAIGSWRQHLSRIGFNHAEHRQRMAVGIHEGGP